MDYGSGEEVMVGDVVSLEARHGMSELIVRYFEQGEVVVYSAHSGLWLYGISQLRFVRRGEAK